MRRTMDSDECRTLLLPDDLLPILEYVILLASTKACPPLRNLVAQLNLIERLSGRNGVGGEEGYCLVTFQAIVAVVLRPDSTTYG